MPNDTASMQEKLIHILQDNAFDGFGNAELSMPMSQRERTRIVEHLLHRGKMPIQPFAFDLALLRAIHVARVNRTSLPIGDFVETLRFGVQAGHIIGVSEVTFNDLQTGLRLVECRADVSMWGEHPSGCVLVEWLAFGFTSIPNDTSDAMWDLFEMDDFDSSPGVYPERDETQGRTRRVTTPIIVSKTRNRDQLDRIRASGQTCQGVGMGHMGATLGVTVFLGSGDSERDRAVYPILSLGHRLPHPHMVGDDGRKASAWIIVSYSPPPIVRGEYVLEY